MTSAEGRARRLAAAGLLVFVASCSRAPDASSPPANAAAPPPANAAAPAPPAPTIEIPKPPPPIDRAALLGAVAQAAEAFATGQAPPPELAKLAGRRFEVRLPFGCHGPAPADAPLGYAWEPKARKLTLRATPQTWTDEKPIRALLGSPATEAIEGFWLSRPWIHSADCPAQPVEPAETAAPQTVGLAQVFDKGGSRWLRRNGRAYEATRRLEDAQTPPASGYRLVLAGRIVDRDGATIRCRSDGADQRPVCFVLVEMDHVSLETPEGDAVADWSS